MLISKTPYRISFFGGGTDYHTWYQEHGGSVLSTSINHYCFIDARYLPPFFNHKYRVVWKQVEEVSKISEIEHPAVRACLQYLKFQRGVEIHHHGGLPSRSGLGSSSSFTVGMLNVLYSLRGVMATKKNLACDAVHLERDLLNENVGIQDQIAASYGGFNKVEIHQDGSFEVHPVTVGKSRLDELEKHLLVFFTGISRNATDIADSKIQNIKEKRVDLREMIDQVDAAIQILSEDGDITDFGRLLHEGWQIKKSISDKVSSGFIDNIYSVAKNAGAIGGKILGAGGGGFLMLFAKPEHHANIKKALNTLLHVPVKFEQGGSSIIYYDPEQYSRSSLLNRNYVHLQAHENDNEVNQLILQKKDRILLK
jgi:D-glycero-alpha-D-manno-heptose-7-phosphate kinase